MKKIIALSLSLLMIVSTACSSNKTDSGSNAKDGGKIELSFAIPDNGPGITFQDELIKEYNDSQDKVHVTIQAYGSSFDTKMAAAIASKTTPDVMKLWNYSVYSPAVAPLDDYIGKLSDKNDFYPTLFNYSTVDGKTLGMPLGFSTRAMYVDTSKLAKANITVDPKTWTMDDFRKYSKETGDGKTGFYTFYNKSSYSMEQFLWTFGSNGWLNDDGTSNLADPNIEKGLQFFRDMTVEDNSVKLNDIDSIALDKDFSTGTYTFSEFGKWLAPTIAAANKNFAVYPLPGFDGHPGYSTVHASFVSISKDCKNKDAAWDFITWYTNEENIKKLMQFEMPVRKSVATETGASTDPLYEPFYYELEQSSNYKSSMLKTAKWGEVSQVLDTVVERTYTDTDVPIATILKEANTQLNEILK